MAEPRDGASDEQLMVRYARGDAAAFDQLFARYERRAYGFFLARVRSPERAADLFQELFLRVHRGRETFREDGRFDAWFFRVARHILADDVRRSGPPLEALGDEHAASGRSPERELEIAEELEAAGALLSEEERVVLVAAKGAGADLTTVARALGRTTAAVRQIASRAARRLRAKRKDVTGDDRQA